jgi:four helix bundle protein
MNRNGMWAQAFELALALIRVANRFPRAEAAGLANEIRTTAMLLPASIAMAEESGDRRILGRELKRSLHILTRMEIQVLICAELGFLERSDLFRLEQMVREFRRLTRNYSPRGSRRSGRLNPNQT